MRSATPENVQSVENVDVDLVTFTARSGPSGPLSSAITAPASSGRPNAFDRVNAAVPSARRFHPDDFHPADVRSSSRTDSSSFTPPSSAALTASASNTARATTSPLPSFSTRTVTEVSTRHPANTTSNKTPSTPNLRTNRVCQPTPAKPFFSPLPPPPRGAMLTPPTALPARHPCNAGEIKSNPAMT